MNKPEYRYFQEAHDNKDIRSMWNIGVGLYDYAIDIEIKNEHLEERCKALEKRIIALEPSRDKEFIDQLHYVHEHVYACQCDYYSNGGYINYYHLEKLDTAMEILKSSLNYVKERIGQMYE